MSLWGNPATLPPIEASPRICSAMDGTVTHIHSVPNRGQNGENPWTEDAGGSATVSDLQKYKFSIKGEEFPASRLGPGKATEMETPKRHTLCKVCM